jgi:predicted RNA-binding protein
MCEQNVYLLNGDGEELIMEAADTVKPEGDGLLLTNIFGEQKVVKAQIHALYLNDSRVILKKTA